MLSSSSRATIARVPSLEPEDSSEQAVTTTEPRRAGRSRVSSVPQRFLPWVPRLRPAGDAGLVALRQPFTVEPLGIALPANAPLLVNLVQNYLDTLEYTGLLTRFKAKWLSDDAWLAELP